MNRSPVPFALLLAALLLGGCASLLNVKRDPFTVYSPQYQAQAAPTGAKVDWQLIVETPLSSDTLDTARMLVMPTPGVLEVFPGARWRDSTPALLRGLLVQGFETSGRIVGVGSSASGLRGDYALAIDLRDFQIEYHDGAPQAAIRFQARLLNYTTNRVLASQAFAAQAPAAGSDPAAAFSAFESALDAVIPQLVEWTFAEGNRAKAAADSRP